MRTRNGRIAIAAALVLALIAGIVVVARDGGVVGRTHLVAYFDNSNGIFVGDEVRIVGVPVGEIDKIEPEPTQGQDQLLARRPVQGARRRKGRDPVAHRW